MAVPEGYQVVFAVHEHGWMPDPYYDLPYPTTYQHSGIWYPYGAVTIPFPSPPTFPKQPKRPKPPKVKKKKAYFAQHLVDEVQANSPFALGNDYPRYPEGTIPPQYFTPIEQPVSWPMIVLVGAAFYLFLTWTK